MIVVFRQFFNFNISKLVKLEFEKRHSFKVNIFCQLRGYILESAE
jgi:hypothetical protein